MYLWVLSFYFFFFQAEDGIRDTSVTGVQTCALPISEVEPVAPEAAVHALDRPGRLPGREEGILGHHDACDGVDAVLARSEERRVGKECRSRWGPSHEKKKRERQEQ